MKVKFLNRMNLLLGAAIFSLIGLSSCEQKLLYGPDPMYGPEYYDDSTDVTPKYGVSAPTPEIPESSEQF